MFMNGMRQIHNKYKVTPGVSRKKHRPCRAVFMFVGCDALGLRAAVAECLEEQAHIEEVECGVTVEINGVAQKE